MKNVIVFTVAGSGGPGALGGHGAQRAALELRWVREIFTLVALTPVPTAPPVLDGVVNFKGAIVPVLSLRLLLGGPAARRPPHPGDALILVDVEGTRVALAVDRIDAVTSLAARGDDLVDEDGAVVPVADPPALLAAARQQIEGAHGARA